MRNEHPLRILIVEDEVLIALELEGLLQDNGHEPVGIAANSKEAVELAHSLRPDLALVDVHLADGPTGVEVCRALSKDENTAVLFMTANAKRVPDDFAGACGIIPKPYTGRSVRNAVRYVAERLQGRDPGDTPDNVVLCPAWRPKNEAA